MDRYRRSILRPRPRSGQSENDGAAAGRRGVVGSMPVSNRAELRVGLLEVTRTSHKERALARTQPMKEVYGRTDRIAAIGLNISF